MSPGHLTYLLVAVGHPTITQGGDFYKFGSDYVCEENKGASYIGSIGQQKEDLWQNIGPKKMAYIPSQDRDERPKTRHRTEAKPRSCGGF